MKINIDGKIIQCSYLKVIELGGKKPFGANTYFDGPSPQLTHSLARTQRDRIKRGIIDPDTLKYI